MPLYEYRCSACGAHEEKLQGFQAPTQHDCPRCGSPAGMSRQISRTAFTLAGSGWYASGYSEKSASQPASEPPSQTASPAGASGCACHSPSVQAKVDALDKA